MIKSLLLLFLFQTTSRSAVETTNLTRSFGWDSSEVWQQHDIQELYRIMLDALEQQFKNTAQAELVSGFYEGEIILKYFYNINGTIE